jgi:hypothetical protein
VIYKHYRTEKHGCVSVAFQSEDGVAEIGVSWCSPKDRFNRKKGRTIAEGRLESKRPNGYYFSRAYSEEGNPGQRIYDMLIELDVPRWFDAFEDALEKRWNDEAARQG